MRVLYICVSFSVLHIGLLLPSFKIPYIYVSILYWSLSFWLTSVCERDTDVQNRLLDSVGEGEGGMFRENSIETSIPSRVKQITSPGWMHETSAQGYCTRKTQRDVMEQEAGGGIGMANTCNSMADSCQRMTRPTAVL